MYEEEQQQREMIKRHFVFSKITIRPISQLLGHLRNLSLMRTLTGMYDRRLQVTIKFEISVFLFKCGNLSNV